MSFREMEIRFASLHIPKSGGTTVGAVLKDWLGNGCVYTYPSQNVGQYHADAIGPFQCLHGHYISGIHEFPVSGLPLTTVFREPLELACSIYHFQRSLIRSQGAIHFSGNRYTVPIYIDGTQVRQFNDLDTFIGEMGKLYGLFLPYELNEKNYISVLNSRFFLTGVYSRLEEYIQTLAAFLNREVPPRIPHLNINGNERPVPSSQAVRNFYDNHSFDVELYRYVESRFDLQKALILKNRKR